MCVCGRICASSYVHVYPVHKMFAYIQHILYFLRNRVSWEICEMKYCSPLYLTILTSALLNSAEQIKKLLHLWRIHVGSKKIQVSMIYYLIFSNSLKTLEVENAGGFVCWLKLQLDSSWRLQNTAEPLQGEYLPWLLFETPQQYHLVATAVLRAGIGVNFSSTAWQAEKMYRYRQEQSSCSSKGTRCQDCVAELQELMQTALSWKPQLGLYCKSTRQQKISC